MNDKLYKKLEWIIREDAEEFLKDLYITEIAVDVAEFIDSNFVIKNNGLKIQHYIKEKMTIEQKRAFISNIKLDILDELEDTRMSDTFDDICNR